MKSITDTSLEHTQFRSVRIVWKVLQFNFFFSTSGDHVIIFKYCEDKSTRVLTIIDLNSAV